MPWRDSFAKSAVLFRFILRRDKWRISLWIAGISFLTLIVPGAFLNLYPTQQARDIMAETMRNPAMTAMVGPGQLENYTIGAMTSHQMLLITSLVAALMNILLMTRHTRRDEEDGRIELIRSLPVGRLSSVNAACLVLFAANLALALVTGIGLYALGIQSMNLEGSILYGLVLGGAGFFFAALTSLFAQLSESARSVVGLSISVLIASYLIRAIGDIGDGGISWFSPLGWVTGAEVYSGNHWGPLLLLIGAAIVLIVISNYLNAIRDLGSGFFSAKPGRKNASIFLRSPIGLAWRLQRTGMVSWAIGMLVLGLSYGSVLGNLETFLEGNEMLEQMVKTKEGFSLTEQFIPMLIVVLALLATISPLIAMNKLFAEEKKGRIENLLGRSVSRTKLMGSYLIISAINGFVMISFAALGLWASGNVVMENSLSFSTIYGAALAYYPAMLVMISLSVLLIGTAPKAIGFIWLYVFYSFIVLYLGGLFQFEDWAGKLSPYGHVPNLPVEEMSMINVIGLFVIATIMIVFGFVAYNKRDING